MKKIAFLGSKEIGYQTLNHLIENAEKLDVIVTAVFSNHRNISDSNHSILDLATSNKIQVYTDADELLHLDSIDYIFSVQYHQILKQQHIDCAKELAINLHMAPVPEYRGCNQFSFAIIDEAKEFGTTIHELNSGIDSGDILFEKRFPISKNETVISLHQKTTEASVSLFKERIEDIVSGGYTKTPQKNYQNIRSFGFHLRNEINDIKQIDLNWDHDKIDRYIRATYFPPFSPPFAMVNGKKIELSLNWEKELNR